MEIDLGSARPTLWHTAQQADSKAGATASYESIKWIDSTDTPETPTGFDHDFMRQIKEEEDNKVATGTISRADGRLVLRVASTRRNPKFDEGIQRQANVWISEALEKYSLAQISGRMQQQDECLKRNAILEAQDLTDRADVAARLQSMRKWTLDDKADARLTLASGGLGFGASITSGLVSLAGTAYPQAISSISSAFVSTTARINGWTIRHAGSPQEGHKPCLQRLATACQLGSELLAVALNLSQASHPPPDQTDAQSRMNWAQSALSLTAFTLSALEGGMRLGSQWQQRRIEHAQQALENRSRQRYAQQSVAAPPLLTGYTHDGLKVTVKVDRVGRIWVAVEEKDQRLRPEKGVKINLTARQKSELHPVPAG